MTAIMRNILSISEFIPGMKISHATGESER